jgi:L-threonylcarbamoyladenylate synthase
MEKEMIDKAIDSAIEVFKNGGVVIYPTDTIWGIGCDATNEMACVRINEIKNRPATKSFIVLVDSVQMLERFVPEIPEVCYQLIDSAVRPLTIIYANPKGLANSLLAEDGSVGIRVTNDPICKKMIRSLRKPIVSSSVNLSGEASATVFSDISNQLKTKVDYVFPDTGLSSKTPSQIIKIGLNSSVQIIRN